MTVSQPPAPFPGASPSGGGTPGEVFRAALVLGLTSFGGPVAHIGYFRRDYVERRRWLSEAAFADLVALAQLLPGPASSQLGIAIGTRRAGPLGGLAAWLGFTLPSAAIMLAFGLLSSGVDLSATGWVHGLKVAAVAVVAQAIWAMSRSLTPDVPRRVLAVVAAVVSLLWASSLSQVVLILAGAAAGWALLPPPPGTMAGPGWRALPRWAGLVCLATFAGLLAGLPLAFGGESGLASLFRAFFQAGSLVFGGGHVVLPMLKVSVVDPGWVSSSQFLAAYGAAQAVPGPLFTIAAALGAMAVVPSGPGAAGLSAATASGVAGAVAAIGGIFLSSFLLVFGTLPFWDRLRRSPGFRRALAGTNAVVVGILVAAFWDPIWTGGIRAPADAALAAVGLGLLLTNRVPPIAVVGLCAVAGQVLGAGAA